MTIGIVQADARRLPFADGSARCCVTSPPYFGLRDYGADGQIGLEPTPDAYVKQLVSVFREVRRVLADDGTLWLNLGDSYGGDRGNKTPAPDSKNLSLGSGSVHAHAREFDFRKQLVGIPWRVAFALQADGWYVRSDIIWYKPNVMPESVRDRPTKAHEYLFLLSKQPSYYYNADAIREESATPPGGSCFGKVNLESEASAAGQQVRRYDRPDYREIGRNARSVWAITTKPFSGAHFATMPVELAERCIRAGSAEGDRVLDPFGGAGTTGFAAYKLGRDCLLTELNPAFAAMARDRIAGEKSKYTLFEPEPALF